MAMKDVWTKAAKVLSANTSAAEDIGDIYLTQSLKQQGLFKAYMPKYLYNPPFGYPREENLVLARKLAQNPYIYSIEKTIADEVSLAKWSIDYKEGSEKKDTDALKDLKDQITRFFNNPNQNKESFTELRKMLVRDIIECDSGVWVKVFNRKGELCQMFARDGSSFLLNPDIYGYMGNRDEIIEPLQSSWQMGQRQPQELVKQYSVQYREKAAYFQYGTSVTAAVPIPFGRREIVYIKTNPRSESPYGKSPISLLADLIVTLVYGQSYNLDFYMNNNMPEGIISLVGAQQDEISAFRKRIEKEFRVQDDTTGFMRKTAFKVPITPSDAKFIPFQLDPKTMQILEQQQWFYKLALACFGIPEHAMGIEGGDGLRTGDGDNQLKLYLRKSARYHMAAIKYAIDNEILPEFGQDAWEHLEFSWDEYDLDEELKKYQLYMQQYQLQIISPKQIAEKEGLDYEEAEQFFEEKRQKDMEMAQAGKMNINQNIGGAPGQSGPDKPNDGKTEQSGDDIEAKKQKIKEYIEKLRQKREATQGKNKYIKREGYTGNYKYTYEKPMTAGQIMNMNLDEATPEEMQAAYDYIQDHAPKYTARDLEAAKRWLSSKPNLREKFGSQYYEFAVQVAKAINEGYDPDEIDWGAMGTDIAVEDSLSNLRQYNSATLRPENEFESNLLKMLRDKGEKIKAALEKIE